MTEEVTGLRAVGLQEGAASARIKPLLPVLRPHGSGTQSYAESPHGSGTIKRPKCVVYDVCETHTTCYLSLKKTILVSMLPLSSIDDKSSIEDMFSEGRLGSKDCFKYALNTIDPLFNY
jgi:hypothetical protein